MDTYQAVYDAVRSKISGANISDIAQDVIRQAFDMSYPRALIQEQIGAVGYEWSRPFVVMRPKLYQDGNQWCALLGDNIQEGVYGFGESPEKAAAAFDKAWYANIPASSSLVEGDKREGV